MVAQATIAAADATTAYAVGMHLMSVGSELAAAAWPPETRQRILSEVVSRGALINQTATEPELGSPQGGGRPATTMRADGPGAWRISGHKTFTTLAPALDYFITFVAVDGTEEIARVAVPASAPGLRIEETWDALGLRATGSNDVFFENVAVRDEDVLFRREVDKSVQRLGDFAWFALLVSASAYGVARAARDYTVAFARERQPTGYADPIAKLPVVRAAIGRIDAELLISKSSLLRTAETWDTRPDLRGASLAPQVAATKLHVTDAAVAIVDRCMRLVGGVSLHRSEPLERYYRDVRGPLHNPPIEPRGLEMIARAALDD